MSELWNPLLVALDDRALTHDSVHAHFNQLARAPPAVRRSVESCTEIVLMRSTADVDGARPDVDETVLSDSFTTLRFPALRRVTIDAFLPSAFGLGEMGALAGTRQSLEDRVELLSRSSTQRSLTSAFTLWPGFMDDFSMKDRLFVDSHDWSI